MSKWAARATEHFAHKSPGPTPITPETHLMGVLGVGPGRIPESEGQVLGVLGVPTQSIPESRIVKEAELMAAAMRACDYWGDSEKGRSEMREQCLAVPTEQRSELMTHFRSAYRA